MGRFYTETNRPGHFEQPKCAKTFPKYMEVVNKQTGKIELKEVEKINFYEKIQAAAEGITLKEIINKYGINPIDSAMKIEESNIYDYTGAPKDLMEALECANNAKNLFDNASKEIKQEFGNNYNEFLASAMNGKLAKVIEKYNPKPKKVETEQAIVKEELKSVTQEKTQTGVSYD